MYLPFLMENKRKVLLQNRSEHYEYRNKAGNYRNRYVSRKE